MKNFKENLLHFFVVFVIVLIVTLTILYSFGFVPKEFNSQDREDTLASKLEMGPFKGLGFISSEDSPLPSPVEKEKGEIPYRIVATSIGLDAVIQLPTSNDNVILDQALSRGPVYYPGSGLAGNGNMFVFGHSTSFQVVNNKAYQVFNNLKNLKEDDEIKVYGENKVYTYKVRGVELVNKNEAWVDLSPRGSMLTLSTCNSFGQKSDRYVVEADLVSSTSY